jgi:hypothetical protein
MRYTTATWRRLAVLSAAGGLLWINNCMAALERNLDILVSPEAVGNLAVVPYSAVAGLLSFLLQLAPG